MRADDDKFDDKSQYSSNILEHNRSMHNNANPANLQLSMLHKEQDASCVLMMSLGDNGVIFEEDLMAYKQDSNKVSLQLFIFDTK